MLLCMYHFLTGLWSFQHMKCSLAMLAAPQLCLLYALNSIFSWAEACVAGGGLDVLRTIIHTNEDTLRLFTVHSDQ